MQCQRSAESHVNAKEIRTNTPANKPKIVLCSKKARQLKDLMKVEDTASSARLPLATYTYRSAEIREAMAGGLLFADLALVLTNLRDCHFVWLKFLQRKIGSLVQG